MSRWLLTSVPALVLLLGLIVIVVGGAVLIQRGSGAVTRS